MKLSQMILGSMNAVADYDISFEAKLAEVERLQTAYEKATALEEQQALEWYNKTFNNTVAVATTKDKVKKVTKLETLINAVQMQLDNGLSISEAIQAVRSSHLKKDYIKTERVYVSKLKAHFK